MVQLKEGQRYDMPTAFGPSIYKTVTRVPELVLINTSFETTRDAAAALLPRYFELNDDNTVFVNRLTYKGVDYLGGREYREILIGVNAVYNGPKERLAAPYMAAVWVSEIAALISGREIQGYPKLHADIPAVASPDETDTIDFEMSEYGARLLSGTVRNLKRLPDTALEKIKARDNSHSFGWKYIPGTSTTPDVDYPTFLTMRWDYQRAWTGDGSVKFDKPDSLAAPSSSQAIRALGALPVKEFRRTFVTIASAEIDRGAVRRLGD